MDLLTWLVYVGVTIVVVLTPGPGVLFAISNGVRYGVRTAFIASLGNAIGLFFVSCVAIIGLGTLLKSSIIIFTLLKILGAFYLMYLGIRQWKSDGHFLTPAESIAYTKRPAPKDLFIKGLCIAPTNPKAILFFTALFPQFIKTTQPIMAQFLILTFTQITLSMVAHVTYAYIGNSTKIWFSSVKRIKIFNRISGTLFMFFGIGMLGIKGEGIKQ